MCQWENMCDIHTPRMMTINVQEKMMNPLKCADRMLHVHSDIRGPLFMEAME